MWNALLSPDFKGVWRRRASAAAICCLVAAKWSVELAAEPAVEPSPDAVARAAGPIPYKDRLPNLVLKTHEGKNVRFYDDLLKDKIVLINFMYVTCDGR